MDVNLLQQLGLEGRFGEDDSLFEAEDLLDGAGLPMVNPWAFPPRAAAEPEMPAARWKNRDTRKALALTLTFHILIFLVCAAVISVSMILLFNRRSDSILGYHIKHVTSASMTPAPRADGKILKGGFRENDAVLIKNAAPEMVEKGDIITFWQDDEHREAPVIHRVVDVLNNGGSDIWFITKGDNNEVVDTEPVPGARLIGIKVFTMPKLGFLLQFAEAHPWIAVGICAAVMAVGFVIFIV